MEQLRIGGVPEHFNLPWHLAIENDRFNGLSVHWMNYPGGTGAMSQALTNGEIDCALMLTEGTVAEIIRGKPFRIVQNYVVSPLLWGIHVAAKGSIQHENDIQGKVFAISRYYSGSHLMAYVDADQRSWGTDDLKFEVVKDIKGAEQALKNGKADVFLWEQYTTQPYVDEGIFRRVGVRPTPWPAFVLVARNDVLAEKQRVIQAVQRTINATAEEFMEHSAKSINQVAERYGLDRNSVADWFAKTRWSTTGEVNQASLNQVVRMLTEVGIIEHEVAPENLCCALTQLV